MYRKVLLIAIAVFLFLVLQVQAFNTWQEERDDISILAAYAYVYNDWQDRALPPNSRGYNIGCVLVGGNTENDNVVWAPIEIV